MKITSKIPHQNDSVAGQATLLRGDHLTLQPDDMSRIYEVELYTAFLFSSLNPSNKQAPSLENDKNLTNADVRSLNFRYVQVSMLCV